MSKSSVLNPISDQATCEKLLISIKVIETIILLENISSMAYLKGNSFYLKGIYNKFEELNVIFYNKRLFHKKTTIDFQVLIDASKILFSKSDQ